METFVLFPVRCQTCNKVLGSKQYPYEKLVAGYIDNDGTVHPPISPKEAMDRLGISRYCCRSRVLNAPRYDLGFVTDPTLGPTRPQGSISEGVQEQRDEIARLRHQLATLTIAEPMQLPTGGALTAMQNPQPIHVSPPTARGDVHVGYSPAIPQLAPLGQPSTGISTPHQTVGQVSPLYVQESDLPVTPAQVQQVQIQPLQPIQPLQTVPQAAVRPGGEVTTQLGQPRMSRVFRAI
jgi:DNA-directed RNA polymerase subunit N (RpoN/RPB10)